MTTPSIKTSCSLFMFSVLGDFIVSWVLVMGTLLLSSGVQYNFGLEETALHIVDLNTPENHKLKFGPHKD